MASKQSRRKFSVGRIASCVMAAGCVGMSVHAADPVYEQNDMPKPEHIEPFWNGFAQAWANGKCGIVDTSGRFVVPPKYSLVENFGRSDVTIAENISEDEYGRRIEKFGLVDKSGREVTPLKYDELRYFENGLAKVGVGTGNRSRKYGFIDERGKEVIPVIYDRSEMKYNSKYISVHLGDKEGLYRLDKLVIPVEYDDVRLFEPFGFIEVWKGRKCGYADTEGKFLTDFVYDNALGGYDWYNDKKLFDQGLEQVRRDGKYGFIDAKVREVIPCMFDDAYDFSSGRAKVELNGKYGYIDMSGREVIPIKYDSISRMGGGAYKICMAGKYGMVDSTGKELAPAKYDQIRDFSYDISLKQDWSFNVTDSPRDQTDKMWNLTAGFAAAQIDGKWGFLDASGVEAIALRWDDAQDFHEGFAGVKSGDRWGFIDTAGKAITPMRYKEVREFQEGMAAVRRFGWGFVDTTGKVAIHCKYGSVEDFTPGKPFTIVRTKYWITYHYVDRKGKHVTVNGRRWFTPFAMLRAAMQWKP